MFGKPSDNNNHRGDPSRPNAAERAKILGGGLVQVVVTEAEPLTWFLFLNDRQIPQMEVDSLYVQIEAPTDDNPGGHVEATLAYQVKSVSGQRSLQRQGLFPCTIEIIAAGRRLGITATSTNSLDGLWIDLGLKPDGTGHEVSGAQALEVILDETVLSARLTWNDGQTEELFPVVIAE